MCPYFRASSVSTEDSLQNSPATEYTSKQARSLIIDKEFSDQCTPYRYLWSLVLCRAMGTPGYHIGLELMLR
jgi:hypothetical protein